MTVYNIEKMKKSFKHVFLIFLIISLAVVFSNSASAEEFRFKSPSGPTLTAVADVAVDSSGNIYAVVEHNVIKFSPSGTVLLEIGSFGTGNGDFDSPFGIALDSSGNIYVLDTNNHRVQIFNSAGVFQSTFGTQGTGENQFMFPEGIAVNERWIQILC